MVLSGCAATGQSYTEAPKPKETEALVYIYRVDSFALGGRDAYFYVDGTNVADLTRNGYTWFHAPAGTHKLAQKWPIDVTFNSKMELPVTWEPGQTHYYRFIASMGAPGSMNLFEWELAQVVEEKAIAEMKNTKLQPAFGAQKLIGKEPGK